MERDDKITGKEGMKFTELNDVQRQLQIYDINDPTARNIIRERDDKITGKEGMTFT